MLKVRKSLTEILLEVTNDEIESIATQVFNKAINRGIVYVYGFKIINYIKIYYLKSLLNLFIIENKFYLFFDKKKFLLKNKS